jgi:hypothetical protein
MAGDIDWEPHFSEWAKPPPITEQTRCDNAVSAVRNAVQRSPALKSRSTKVFPQGSYRNRVNVRHDSDVDVGVLCDDTFFFELPSNTAVSQFGIGTPAAYPYHQFKNELEQALVSHFGRAAVTRCNKALRVRATSYHVEADVVPVFEYRTYGESGGYLAGIALLPDKGSRIENFPERLLSSWPNVPLHYENGVSKNDVTGRRFKSVVRIVKKLRNLMGDAGNEAAKPVPSYLIECLVWNTPNDRFAGTAWLPTVRSVIGTIWSATKDDVSCDKWCEVDDIKYLFRPSQPWTRLQAHNFVDKAWDLIGVS